MVALGATGTSYNLGIKDSNASILIQDMGATGTTAGFLLFKDSGGSNAAALNIYSSSSTLASAVVLKNIKSAPVIFMTNNTERLRIDSAGNVGIGVTSPSSALEVNGAIKCKDLKVTLTGWPDYVFDPSYKLADLQVVERQIKENHHLSGIPSAEAVGKDGMSVPEMMKKQLEKIEELTLYMIELKKDQQALKSENQALKLRLDNLSK